MKFPLWRRRREQELNEEINSHLRMAARERTDRGESADEALISAKRDLGNSDLIKNVARQMWGLMWLERLVQDLRYGIRMLLRDRGFTAVVVLSLALGIGANTAIFSVVNVLWFKPLPYPQPGQLMSLEHKTRFTNGYYDYWTYPAFAQFRAESKSFEQVAAYFDFSSTLTVSDDPGKENGEIVSADYFPMFGLNASPGRTFLPEEDVVPDAHAVILLSHDLWLKRTGGDPAIIGKTVYLEKNPFTVIGILPDGFRGQSGTKDFWIPTMMTGTVWSPRMLTTNSNFLQVIARIKPDVSLDQAKAELPIIEPKLAEFWPKRSGVVTRESKLVPLKDSKIDPAVARAFLILLAAVVCVLLIACANTANLLLARAIARQREFAVRLALGAGRNRIIRQVLTESLLLSITGGFLGLLVAFWGVNWLTVNKPWNSTARWTMYAGTFEYFSVKLDWRVLLFNFMTAVMTGVIFGLVPALQASRLQLSETLKQSAGSSVRGFRSLRRVSARGVLTVIEIALSVVLLAGAGLMIKSMSQLSAVKLGFVPDNVITMTVGPGGRSQDFFQEVIDQVRTLPGVTDASLAVSTPLAERMVSFALQDDEVIDGRSPSETKLNAIGVNTVTSDYFDTFRIKILKGRAFSGDDRANTTRVTVLSRAMADACWPDKDPIGRRLRLPIRIGDQNLNEYVEVIGVVDDVKYAAVDQAERLICYLPFSQPSFYWPQELSFRNDSDPVSAVAAIRSEIKKINNRAPIYEITTMKERTSQATSRYRYSAVLLAMFAGLALLLASVGIYGVIRYSVSARTREIGIRVALGALPSGIARLVIADGVAMIAVGLVIGLASAAAATRVLSSQLYQVDTVDPFTFAIVTTLLIVVGLLACYLPARRAMKVDPMVALRYE